MSCCLTFLFISFLPFLWSMCRSFFLPIPWGSKISFSHTQNSLNSSLVVVPLVVLLQPAPFQTALSFHVGVSEWSGL